MKTRPCTAGRSLYCSNLVTHIQYTIYQYLDLAKILSGFCTQFNDMYHRVSHRLCQLRQTRNGHLVSLQGYPSKRHQ